MAGAVLMRMLLSHARNKGNLEEGGGVQMVSL